MELTHGMRVTCEIAGWEITDAKISKNANGRFYICQNKYPGVVTAENKLGYKYSWEIGSESVADSKLYDVTNLRPAKDISDIKSYEVGDILLDEDGDRHKVLGICDLVVMLSWGDSFERTGVFYTSQELVSKGYNFEEPKDTLIGKELTQTIKGKKYKVVVKEEIDG